MNQPRDPIGSKSPVWLWALGLLSPPLLELAAFLLWHPHPTRSAVNAPANAPSQTPRAARMSDKTEACTDEYVRAWMRARGLAGADTARVATCSIKTTANSVTGTVVTQVTVTTTTGQTITR